jgi:hypothetical protein
MTDPAGLFQMALGFEAGGFVGSFQADQLGQGWSIASSKPRAAPAG